MTSTTSKSGIPKDRGWAWMCVFSCFMLLLIELGGAKSFGVIFAEFLEKFDTSTGAAAWISSLNGFFAMALGPFTTSLGMRFSNRTMIMIGGVFYGLGYFLSSFAPRLTYLYFSYGVITGIGMGCSYPTAVVTVAQYFEKRRALANGIAVAGSGVGNFLIPLTMRYLIDHYSLQGALMIYGGIGFNVCVCGALMRPTKFYLKWKRTDAGKEQQTASKENLAVAPNFGSAPVVCMNSDPTEEAKAESITISSNGKEESQSLVGHSKSNVSYIDASREHIDNQNEDIDIYRSHNNLSNEKHKSAFYGFNEIGAASAQSIPDLVDKLDTNNGSESGEQERDGDGCLGNIYKRICTLPPGPDGKRKPMFDWSLLRNPVFHVYYWAVLFSSCGYPSVFIMLPKFATELDLTKIQATWLVSIVGISDLVGRIVFGFISDFNIIKKKYGFMGSMLLSGVTCLLFPFLSSFEGLGVLCCVFGLFGGSYIALTAVILVEALGADKLPNAFGLSVLGQGIAMLIAFPFIGFLRDTTGNWSASLYFCGVAMTIGASCVLFEPLAKKKIEGSSTMESENAALCCTGSKLQKELVDQIISQV